MALHADNERYSVVSLVALFALFCGRFGSASALFWVEDMSWWACGRRGQEGNGPRWVDQPKGI